jgi:hypothetical protein
MRQVNIHPERKIRIVAPCAASKLVDTLLITNGCIYGAGSELAPASAVGLGLVQCSEASTGR